MEKQLRSWDAGNIDAKTCDCSDGGSAWELSEVCQVQCGASTNGSYGGNGGQLLHISLTTHNYLTAVTALDVER